MTRRQCYYIFVRRDYGRALGAEWIVTQVVGSPEKAWDDLDKTLIEMVAGKQLLAMSK
jgi:hypothetical protein